ncbi:16S rRNA (uracil(1498)-N(3))-methyltransferase [Campylobacter insulaenigrae]|uniref:16S rRNA (uracil(1498)-N(3))-methyltransferase n=1 Tax=Campylobacter insulaenigrae TaxID=260714 RepID=UPI002152A934|nr:16S rRNA (uracil(1498)-N(3))-methyltransferase [Campylobacter insulaenigrae]MCR6594431.1 16S rRNA (uracil(1498)-N(3))-methyltransferase [Campylobacter insulaenigrae]
MRFLYHIQSGEEYLKIENETFLHLKARRLKEEDEVAFKNFKDKFTYIYKCVQLEKKFFLFVLKEKKIEQIQQNSKLHLALAVIDPKVIEKTLPFLNELGVEKLSLVYMQYSQRNFRLDEKRMEKILIESSQQCGRNSLLKLEIYKDFEQFQSKYKNIVLIDFEGENLLNFNPLECVFLVGAEGGFSQLERTKCFQKAKLNIPFVLKAQTAIIALASKFII